MRLARRGFATDEMKFVAESEYLSVETVRSGVAAGGIIIPANLLHKSIKPIGIGKGLRIKINANIGNSQVQSGMDDEMQKLNAAIRYEADAVMDLSTGGGIDSIRKAIIEKSPLPVGTVPVYQAVENFGEVYELSEDDFIDIVEWQAAQGVDFMTIHCGLLKEHIPFTSGRLTGIVSRGGALMARWMTFHDRENPYYVNFDKILEISAKYDVSLSLGDGLRPGCLADANDAAQFAELKTLGELTRKAWEKDVQVMIEGPGHVPFDLIEENIRLQKELCHGAPFYVLGPLVTDIAPGYDHITSAIGATMAAYCGADMLCYVTPREHLGLPEIEDVREGIIAFKIAAHAADVALKRARARERDDEMARARYDFDWKKQFSLSLDPEKAKELRGGSAGKEEDNRYCSMCGPKYCPMRSR